jgi:hypothetical protein
VNYAAMEAFGEEFAGATGRPFYSFNNRIAAGSEKNLGAVVERYKDADLILTGRLHACIIGLAMGRKVLAVSGDRKVDSFMRAAGLGEWVLELCDVTSVPQKLRDLSGQPAPDEFIARTRVQHQEIAAQIRLLLA